VRISCQSLPARRPPVFGLARIFITVTVLLLGGAAWADDIRAAVASNFSAAMPPLAEAFEGESRHTLIINYGATVDLHKQILNGAPFDVFLAADDTHPRQLEKDAVAVSGSRFTYAIGQLALWSTLPGYVDDHAKVLRTGSFKHIALANPQTAPYGAAAKEYLRTNGLLRKLKPRFVFGEDVSRTYQLIAGGGAELGFVALSQLAAGSEANRKGSLYLLPAKSYPRLKQQAILLRHNDAAAAWLAFLQSEKARDIIRQHGYLLP
jgi:molybdate transport system substrate-binding protein